MRTRIYILFTFSRHRNIYSSLYLVSQKSLVFVKRMMAIAVSSITYLRGIFPECAYRSRYLEDLCIKVLRENSNTPGANKIVKWMMGCFDALEKQYVSPVYTDPKDRNCIIESYQFNFRYTEKGPEMDIVRNNAMGMQVALEDTKRASVLLIRKLFLLLQNLDALPSNVYLTMKLYYYDDVTPADYQPPGFQEGVHDRLWFQGVPVHFKVGQVHTTYHSLRVRVSVEQGHVKKLQEGNYLKEPVRVSLRKEAIKVGLDRRLYFLFLQCVVAPFAHFDFKAKTGDSFCKEDVKKKNNKKKKQTQCCNLYMTLGPWSLRKHSF
uniref:Zebrafish testis-expressed 38 n=1 Tax=Poecilia reticulata TaxID=8081 RepID=A0A3P9NAW6_POERE